MALEVSYTGSGIAVKSKQGAIGVLTVHGITGKKLYAARFSSNRALIALNLPNGT